MPGHVRPGGEPLVQRLSATVTLIKLSVGPMDNNAYVLRTDTDAVLIDAANDPDRLLAVLAAGAPSTILTTHRHQDHIQALADVAEATGATLVAGAPDARAIEEEGWVSDVHGLWDGATITLGHERLEVIGLVGHTPGSVALAYRPPGRPAHVFTGDSLFPGGVGRTTRPADFESLLNDVESKIFARFDDSTVVHPGHGDDTTLGAERPHLSEWRARGW